MLNDFKNIKELIEYPREGILSKEVTKTELVEVSLFCMAAGSALSPHTSSRQALVYVVDGQGVFKLQEKKIPMTKGVLIHMGAGALHELSAITNLTFMLTLID